MNCCFQFDQNNVYMEERDLHLSKYLLGRVPDEFRGAKKVAEKKAAKPTKKKRDP